MLQFGTNMAVKRGQNISAPNDAGEQLCGDWEKLLVLLDLAWLATEIPGTAISITSDRHTSVALFSLAADLLV